MKRYISLAGALLVGTVLAKDTKKEKTTTVATLQKTEVAVQVAAVHEVMATKVEYVSDYTSNVQVEDSLVDNSPDNEGPDADVREVQTSIETINEPDTSINVRVNSVTTNNDGPDADNDVVSVRSVFTNNTYNTPDVRAATTTQNDAVTSDYTSPAQVEAYTSVETSANPATTPEAVEREWTSAGPSAHEHTPDVREDSYVSDYSPVVMNDVDTTPDADGIDSCDTSVAVESAWTDNTNNTWNVERNNSQTVSFHSVERHISPITDNSWEVQAQDEITSCDNEDDYSPVRVEFRRRQDSYENTPDVRGISDNDSAWDFNYEVKVRDLYDDDDVYSHHDYDTKVRDFYDELEDLENHGFKGVCGRKYDVPIGEAFWCDDRQEGLRTNCVVVSKYQYKCCVSKYGCDDERDFKTWRF